MADRSEPETTDPADIAAACRDADAVIVNLEPIPRWIIEGMRRCRINLPLRVGYDNVDIAAATECGIWVARVPDSEDVSDHALALFLACVRRVPYTDRGIRDGGWGFPRNRPSYRVRGTTLGLLGYGAIAHAVHRKLSGLGLARVLAHDPYVDSDEIRTAGAELAGAPRRLGGVAINQVGLAVRLSSRETQQSKWGHSARMVSKPISCAASAPKRGFS